VGGTLYPPGDDYMEFDSSPTYCIVKKRFSYVHESEKNMETL
jgi:hypothetical protein